jgi:hypothetical protein
MFPNCDIFKVRPTTEPAEGGGRWSMNRRVLWSRLRQGME